MASLTRRFRQLVVAVALAAGAVVVGSGSADAHPPRAWTGGVRADVDPRNTATYDHTPDRMRLPGGDLRVDGHRVGGTDVTDPTVQVGRHDRAMTRVP